MTTLENQFQRLKKINEEQHTLINNLENSIENGEKKTSHIVNTVRKMPSSYLKEREIKQYEDLLAKIKTADFIDLTPLETEAYKFIDSIVTRHDNDLEKLETKKDKNYSFKVFAIISNRKEIQKWLIMRLLNEICIKKQQILLEKLKLNDDLI